jgi:hypothetical protein
MKIGFPDIGSFWAQAPNKYIKEKNIIEFLIRSFIIKQFIKI